MASPVQRKPAFFNVAVLLIILHLIADIVGGSVAFFFAQINPRHMVSFYFFQANSGLNFIFAALIAPTALLDVLALAGLSMRKNWARYLSLLAILTGISQLFWKYELSEMTIGIYAGVCLVLAITLFNRDLVNYLRSAPRPVQVPMARPVQVPEPVPMARPVPEDIPLAQPIPPPVKDEKALIKFSSDYDYFQGFVRLKVWVVNGTETVITDCRVRLMFDENFMRINQVDPPLPIKNDEVNVGTVNPDEKKTLCFLLDPLMCQTINLDGTLTYRDARGKLGTIPMRPQPIGVTCPIYATPETINTATALNLAKNVLNHRDSRIYNIPKAVTCQKALTIAQGVVQRRSVKHVSDLKAKQGFGVMSIYYGVSKLDNRQYIIRTTVLEETGTLELFVAADDESMLTGELAKLGQDLNEALCAEAKVCEPIRHVNISIKDSVLVRTNLLFGDELEGASGRAEVHDSALVGSQVGTAGKR